MCKTCQKCLDQFFPLKMSTGDTGKWEFCCCHSWSYNYTLYFVGFLMNNNCSYLLDTEVKVEQPRQKRFFMYIYVYIYMHLNKLVVQNSDTWHCSTAHVTIALEGTFQTAQPLGERLSLLHDAPEWGGLSFQWSPEGHPSDISYKI